MRIVFLTALLATVASVPAYAQHNREDGPRGRAMERAEMREERNSGNESERRSAERAQQVETRTAPAQQSASPWENRRGEWRGQRVETSNPPAVPQAGGSPREDRRGGWRGTNPDGNLGNRTPGSLPGTRDGETRRYPGGGRRPGNDVPTPDVRHGGTVGSPFDRNGDGRVDPYYDRNGNGRVDERWDNNKNGRFDRRWDQNRDGQLDRRWDRDGNGELDRRWDHDGNGRVDNHWNNGWRNDHRYDWQHHRNSYRNVYRAPRYYNPYGYGSGYRRFSIGFQLDALFFGSRYWISDPWQYRLPPAYGSYRWVRYYDDVLLVDLRTGRVVDVISDFFW